VRVIPITTAEASPFELELVFRLDGWQRGKELGTSVGKFKTGSVGGEELAARVHPAVNIVKRRIMRNCFIFTRVYHQKWPSNITEIGKS
jgi:hypothetical protein